MTPLTCVRLQFLHLSVYSGHYERKVLLSVDPDTPSVTRITDITQTRVTISWSVGQTRVVNTIRVYYRATGSTRWTSVSVSGTTHTVSSLQPGTRYQFYVLVDSYGKTSTSANAGATTGMTGCFFIFLCFVLRLCLQLLAH